MNPKLNKKFFLGGESYVTIAWKGFAYSPKFFCPPLYRLKDVKQNLFSPVTHRINKTYLHDLYQYIYFESGICLLTKTTFN